MVAKTLTLVAFFLIPVLSHAERSERAQSYSPEVIVHRQKTAEEKFFEAWEELGVEPLFYGGVKDPKVTRKVEIRVSQKGHVVALAGGQVFQLLAHIKIQGGVTTYENRGVKFTIKPPSPASHGRSSLWCSLEVPGEQIRVMDCHRWSGAWPKG